MTWDFCVNAQQIIDERSAHLHANESQNNLTWSALQKSKSNQSSVPLYHFLTFKESEIATAHAIFQKQSHHVLLSEMSKTQAIALIDFIDRSSLQIDELEGPTKAAQYAFAYWRNREKRSYRFKLNQGLYEVRQVQMPELEGGEMISARSEHRDLLIHWLSNFSLDCFPDLPVKTDLIENRTERFLKQKRAYIWRSKEKELVSVAAVVRETPNTSSISAVYTPPSHRGRGYAGKLVASLSQVCIDSGKSACNLHTDLSNPISNKVYTRVGYQLIGEAMRYTMTSLNEG